MEVTSVRPRAFGAALPALAAALMPKCPLCLVALAGALGVEWRAAGSWLGPSAIALMLASIAAVGYAAIRRGQRVPLFFLAVAAMLMLAETGGVRHLEALLVIIAALLTALPKKHHCKGETT